MTETEWLECKDPIEMAKHFNSVPQYSDRKGRMLACAFCGRVRSHLQSEWSRQAVEVAERYADGKAGPDDIRAAIEATYVLDIIDEDQFYPTADHVFYNTLRAFRYTNMPLHIAVEIGRGTSQVLGLDPWGSQEEHQQCVLIRELIGNPFRPIALETNWLTPDVVTLAEMIYEGRAFDRLPILADTLEEAGCHDADMLAHCRTPGEHVRGCWVVDLILGKQ